MDRILICETTVSASFLYSGFGRKELNGIRIATHGRMPLSFLTYSLKSCKDMETYREGTKSDRAALQPARQICLCPT